MALQFLDNRLVGGYIIDAWQNQLNTEMDPANGQWFTADPTSKTGGLYGGLTDTLATELIFDESKKIFSPHQIAAITAIADNRNGLTPNQTVTLQYAYQDSISSSHSTSSSIKTGIGMDIKTSAKFFGIGVDITTKFSFEFTTSWTDTKSETKTETKTFTQSVPVTVPKGKVYQVVLLCNKDELTMPYSANIYLDGNSKAFFANPVNGQKDFVIDAGTMCSWINKFGSAGDQSYKYGRNPANPAQGIISLQGTVTAVQTANFVARTLDITDQFTGEPISTAGGAALLTAPKVGEVVLQNN